MPDLKDMIFSSRRTLYVPSGNENNAILAATAVRNLEGLGFTIDQKGFLALASASKEDISSWYYDTTEKLNKITGNDQEHRLFYPNFPDEVMNKDSVSLFVDQMCHYWFGIDPEGVNKKASIQSLEEHPVKVLKTVSSEKEVADEARDIFRNLLKTKQNLSESERKNILNVYMNNVPNWTDDATTVTNRRNLSYLYAKAITEGKDIRFLPSLTTGDIMMLTKYLSLIKNGEDLDSLDFEKVNDSKVANLPRFQRKMICALLDKQKNLEEDIARDKAQWKAIFRRLHAGEYKKYENLQGVVEKVRRGDSLSTFYSRIENAYKKGDIDTLLKLYKQRPGEMIKSANRLVYFASTHFLDEEALEDTLKTFSEAFPKCRMEDLINLDQYFNARVREDYMPIHNVKGKFYTSDLDRVNHLDPDVIKKIQEIIKESIVEQLKGKDSLGNVYIAPELYKIPLPQDRDGASESLSNYAKGTKIPIERNEEGNPKNIRLAMYFGDNGRSRWDNVVDISVAFYAKDDKSMNCKGYLAWFTHGRKNFGCYHSGDWIGAGTDGAYECIDLNLNSLKEHGITHVMFHANVWSGGTFSQEKVTFGWQERDELTKSNQFDVKAVKQHSLLSGNAMGIIPGILDVEKGEIIWTDYLDHTAKGQSTVREASQLFPALFERYGHQDRLSMGEMVEMHIKANGGEIIDAIQTTDKTAENIFTLSPIKDVPEGCHNITATEQDTWIGKMMTAYQPEETLTRENEYSKMVMNMMNGPDKPDVSKDISQTKEVLYSMFHKEDELSIPKAEATTPEKDSFRSLAENVETKEQEIRDEYFKKFGFESFAADLAVEEMREEEYSRYPGLRDYMETKDSEMDERKNDLQQDVNDHDFGEWDEGITEEDLDFDFNPEW